MNMCGGGCYALFPVLELIAPHNSPAAMIMIPSGDMKHENCLTNDMGLDAMTSPASFRVPEYTGINLWISSAVASREVPTAIAAAHLVFMLDAKSTPPIAKRTADVGRTYIRFHMTACSIMIPSIT